MTRIIINFAQKYLNVNRVKSSIINYLFSSFMQVFFSFNILFVVMLPTKIWNTCNTAILISLIIRIYWYILKDLGARILYGLWDYPEMKSHRSPPANFQELSIADLEEWENIPQIIIQNLIERVHDRILAVNTYLS